MSEGNYLLNLQTLSELKEILEEGLDELLDAYVDDAPSQLALLRNAVMAGDIDAIASIAHTLKGSSGNLGVNGVYLLCQALELEARSGQIDDAAGALAAIEDAFVQAKDELAAFRAQS